MKSKRFLPKSFIGLLIFILFGCAGSPAPSKGPAPGMDLDASIREAAVQMERRIPSKTMVALVSIASPSAAFSTQVLTRLESALVSSGKLIVVDRANLDKIRAEQGFQLSGEVDDESAKSIGKLLGAGAIVTGTLTDLGDVYSLTLKAINLETATVAVSYLADLTKTARIETLLASGGGAVPTYVSSTAQTSTQTTTSSAGATQSAARTPLPPAVVKTPPPAPQNLTTETVEGTSVTLTWTGIGSAGRYRVYYSTTVDDDNATFAGNSNSATYTISNLKRNTQYFFWVTIIEGSLESTKSDVTSATTTNTYKIGDTGPGGGIVFFDKGTFSSGWQYLEAGPQYAEFQAPWGPSGTINTASIIGSGKNNTKLIAAFLKNKGASGAVTQLNDLEINGYQDWFLPSQSELNLMFTNLKQKGLGDFRNIAYWSSTESGSGRAWVQLFDNGRQVDTYWRGLGEFDNRGQSYHVRPVRQF